VRKAFDRMVQNVGQWLAQEGPDGDVVISSRSRYARNISGFRFVPSATKDELETIVEMVETAAKKVLPSAIVVDPSTLHETDRNMLMERNILTRDILKATHPTRVVFVDDESASVLINEEDHIRLQVVEPGLQPQRTLERLNALDDKLEEHLEFAFSERWGYLTACPTNVGTGLRASVMLHLPALVLTRQIIRVVEAVKSVGLALRGFHGEGSFLYQSDFFQVSNQKTLGRSEEAIVENISTILPQVIDYERMLRDQLMGQARRKIEDRVWRAWGILNSSRLISTGEALEMLSLVRLGAAMGLLDGLSVKKVNPLFVLTQPAHIQKRLKGEASEEERDATRADLLRNWFAKN